MTRLEKIYREKVVPVLQKEFNYSSSMQLPGIEKISLNIGLGAASQNNKLMEEAMNEVKMVVEGVYSAKAALGLAHKYETSMPIIEQVNLVLFGGKPAKEAVADLMLRDKKVEISDTEWE